MGIGNESGNLVVDATTRKHCGKWMDFDAIAVAKATTEFGIVVIDLNAGDFGMRNTEGLDHVLERGVWGASDSELQSTS